jgi:predicted transcriptional regulator
MACINSSGQLTESGRRILVALTNPTTLEEVAQQTGLPLYLIRSGVREMAQAGLIAVQGDAYAVSAAGRALIQRQG